MEIKHVEQLGGTPYMMYAVQAHSIMLGSNRCDEHVQMVGWDNRAVVAIREDGVVRGIITYMKLAHINTFSIFLGFVDGAARREGIYRLMWEALVEKAKEEKMFQITGTTKTDNAPMRAVAKALGRTEESINLRYIV